MEEYGAQVASIAIIIISKPKLNPRSLLSNQQKQIRKLLDDNGSTWIFILLANDLLKSTDIVLNKPMSIY